MISIKIFGIRLCVSVGFLGMLSLMLYVDKSGILLITLQATLFHELGHIAVMRILGYHFEKIELKIGAAAICGKFDYSLKHQLLISLAGPMVNIILFLVYLSAYRLGVRECLNYSLVMLVMGILHLLPINGLDGGTVLYCLLAKKLSLKAVTVITKTVSLIFILGLITLGILVFFSTKQNPSLVLLGLYLLFSYFCVKN